MKKLPSTANTRTMVQVHATKGRVAWSHQLSKKEASKITIAEVFGEECW